jgi:hypothetical protein
MKRALCLLMALLIANPSFAGVSRSSPSRAMVMVEDYLTLAALHEKMLKMPDVTEKQKLLQLIADYEYLQQGIQAEILGLTFDDFNVFLLYLLNRYINKPQERATLFEFMKTLRETIEPDLAYSERLRLGPGDRVMNGTMIYGALLLVGILVWHRIFAARVSRHELVQLVRSKQAALANKSKTLRYVGRTLGTSFTVSAAGGAIGGYLEYLLESNRMRRLDPMTMLAIVQAQVACEVSYDTLQLKDRVETLYKDKTQLNLHLQELHAETKRLSAQSHELVEQFDWLANLDVKDRMYQDYLERLPTADSWQKLRSQLSEAEQSQDGQCRQVSLTLVNKQLGEIQSILPELPPAVQEKQ